MLNSGNIELFVDVWPTVGRDEIFLPKIFKFPFVNRETFFLGDWPIRGDPIIVFVSKNKTKNIFRRKFFYSECWHMIRMIESNSLKIRISKEGITRDLFHIFRTSWQRGRIYAGYGIRLTDRKNLRKALQEWRKVNKPYAKLFSAELCRLLGEFDKAKKLLEQAKKHYRKGKAAYYCRVVEELIKIRTTKFYDVPDVIGETQHKVSDNEWLLISPQGVKLKKIVPVFWMFGKKEVVERITKDEAMKYFDKLDELGKAKLLAHQK